MKMLLSLSSMFISIYMIFLNSPLPMGMMILLQTSITCLISGMIMKTYWFSYILFLIFLGGLLVLFIYVSSISPNELFKLNFFFMKSFYLITSLIFIIYLYINYNNLFFMNLSNNTDMDNMLMLKNLMFNKINKFNLNKLYNNHTYIIMLMLMIYLLITLITVVKIINIFYGPLRSNL